MLTPQKPSFRYDRVHAHLRQTGVYTSDDPLEEALSRLLLGGDGVPMEVRRAYSMYRNPFKREVVEAFILARASTDEIGDVLEIDADVTRTYMHLFFDTSVFWDRLDAQVYAQEYPTSHDKGYGKQLKMAAIDHGSEYLKVTFGRGQYQVSPTRAVRESISQAYLYAKSASKYAVDHPRTKEAQKWTLAMYKGIDNMKNAKLADGESAADLLISLKVALENSDRPELDGEILPEDILNRRTED